MEIAEGQLDTVLPEQEGAIPPPGDFSSSQLFSPAVACCNFLRESPHMQNKQASEHRTPSLDHFISHLFFLLEFPRSGLRLAIVQAQNTI